MAKDPAFLFYSSDFLTGTTFMTNEEVGKYIRTLCLLHQHGGRLPKEKIEMVVGNLPYNVLEKLQADKEGNLYNQRLLNESNKRNAFCESRRSNIQHRYNKPTYVKHMNKHMENENENENDNVNKDKDMVLKVWNERMPWKIKEISGSRLTHLKERLKEKQFIDEFHTILTKILESDFLSGRKPSKTHPNFKGDFDFIVKNSINYIKILEDKYANQREVAV